MCQHSLERDGIFRFRVDLPVRVAILHARIRARLCAGCAVRELSLGH